MRKTSYFVAFFAVVATLALVSARIVAPNRSHDPLRAHLRPARPQNILSVQRPDWSVPWPLASLLR